MVIVIITDNEGKATAKAKWMDAEHVKRCQIVTENIPSINYMIIEDVNKYPVELFSEMKPNPIKPKPK